MHLVRVSYALQGYLSPRLSPFPMEGWYPTVLVHLQAQVGQLNPKLFCVTCQSTLLKVNQCAIEFLNHLAYAQFPWTSISNQSIKIVTISDTCNLFHFPTFLYRLLAPGRLPWFWLVDVSLVYAFYGTLHSERRICEHSTDQLKSRISNVSEVCVGRSPMKHLPLSAVFLSSAPSVPSDPGHPTETITMLKAQIKTEVGDSPPEPVVQDAWISCSCDHTLETNKSEHTKTWSEFTGVDQNDRQYSTDSRHWWPMIMWSVWVQPCGCEGGRFLRQKLVIASNGLSWEQACMRPLQLSMQSMGTENWPSKWRSISAA